MLQEPRMVVLSFGLGTLQQVACAQFQLNLLLSESNLLSGQKFEVGVSIAVRQSKVDWREHWIAKKKS